MATAKLYFDTRRTNKDGTYPLRLVVTKKGDRASMVLNINLLPSQWENNQVVQHPNARILNTIIANKLSQAQTYILEKELSGELAGKSASEVLSAIRAQIDSDYAAIKAEEEKRKQEENNSFARYFQSFMDLKKNPGTKRLYQDTYDKLVAFCNESGILFSTLTFKDITKQFLKSFEEFCLSTQKQNTASRHLRDIRAVLNAAIDDGLTAHYPFRKFKIKTEESRDKSYSAKDLRQLFSYKCYPGREQEAVDIFKLMFCLRGINCGDLANLLPTDIRGDRLEYIRQKTHKAFSVKLEPEALEIIEKYKGESHLLNILDRNPNYKTYFNWVGKTLRKVGLTRVSGKVSTGKAIVPEACTGSARTSWGTIAQEDLDIDRDTIAAALGHHTIDVTSTYLRTDWKKKVDQANRRVLDWVFYRKR